MSLTHTAKSQDAQSSLDAGQGDAGQKLKPRLSARPEGTSPAAASGKTPAGRQRSMGNLKAPWPKGVSGNPSGRPKHTRGVWIKVNSADSLMAALLAVMDEDD